MVLFFKFLVLFFRKMVALNIFPFKFGVRSFELNTQFVRSRVVEIVYPYWIPALS
jgi:hypothetical protein